MAHSVEEVIKLIEAAFIEPKPENVITIHEADAIDRCFPLEEVAIARVRDTYTDWRQIPDEYLREVPMAMCFMDSVSIRFHLPAYMCYLLRHFQGTGYLAENAAINCLMRRDNRDIRMFHDFSHAQRAAVRSFLYLLLDCEEYADDVTFALAYCGWDKP